jgi:metallophosphoesterase superfamily enzyme
MPRPEPSQVDIVLVHTSDLHIDDEQNATKHGDGTDGLAAVLAAASNAGADIVLLAGDTFDNNRVPAAVLDRTGRLLADAGIPVVILPGNHDPALPNSVFVRGGLASIPNVTVLGITHDEAVGFGDHDLEIWGHAHRDYENMAPLRGPRARGTVPAYYSGSPDLARTVNVIRLTSNGEVLVTREPLRWDRA